MAVNIKPLGEYVLAQAEEAPSKTASGLYIPKEAQEQSKKCKVLAAGKDVKEVKVGDRIIYDGFSHVDVKHDGQDYLRIKEENIHAIVK